MLSDYHIHSEYSDDSNERMENVIKQAIALKMDEICFTDHVDYGIKIDHYDDEMAPNSEQKVKILYNVNYPKYFEEIHELRKKYGHLIGIKQGLEFGMQTHTIDRYQKLFHTYDLDFVILSCHQVNDKEFWNYDYQKGSTVEEYNTRYYEEIYNCINEYKDYSVLGHLDMIQRYNESIYPFEKSKEIITKILKKVIQDNKGIEVNTSSFRYQLKDLTPARDILILYYQLGGKIISIGSDCHAAKDVGDHITYVQKELKNIGFTHTATFEKMKPILHKL